MQNRHQQLQAVVFDLDGLIANSEDLYEQAGQSVLQRRGKAYDAALRDQMMGRPAVDALRLMIDYHALSDTLEDLAGECRRDLELLLATALGAMPGLIDLLAFLQARELPLAVATSSTGDYAKYVLGHLEIDHHFRFVLTADDIRCGKPDPEVYLLAAQQMEISPSQMMVLEDSANGCRAAVAAGAFTIAVPNRHTQHHAFPGVQFIAETLADPRIRQALSGPR